MIQILTKHYETELTELAGTFGVRMQGIPFSYSSLPVLCFCFSSFLPTSFSPFLLYLPLSPRVVEAKWAEALQIIGHWAGLCYYNNPVNERRGCGIHSRQLKRHREDLQPRIPNAAVRFRFLIHGTSSCHGYMLNVPFLSLYFSDHSGEFLRHIFEFQFAEKF